MFGIRHFDFWYQNAAGVDTIAAIPIGKVVKVGDLDAVTFANATAALAQHAVPTHALKTMPGD